MLFSFDGYVEVLFLCIRCIGYPNGCCLYILDGKHTIIYKIKTFHNKHPLKSVFQNS